MTGPDIRFIVGPVAVRIGEMVLPHSPELQQIVDEYKFDKACIAQASEEAEATLYRRLEELQT